MSLQVHPNSLPVGDCSPDHVYFNLTYFNNYNNILTPTLDQYIPANIIQKYDREILSCPQNWNIAIARFSISSDTIGRVYQTPGTTGGNTTLWVGLSYSGVYYDEPIVLPTITYYNGQQLQVVYNINDFLDLLNTAWSTAQAAVGSAGGPTGPGQVLITLDPVTKFYTVNSPVWYGTGSVGLTGGNGIGIHMSYQLYHKFQSFSVIQNDPLLFNKHDIVFNRVWRGNNYSVLTYPPGPVSPTGAYMQLFQDAEWESSVQDVTRLLITTTTLPTIQEYRAQQFYSQGQGGPGNQTQSIITDFFIGSDTDIVNRAEHWIYQPTLLRLCSLTSTRPLRELDLQLSFSIADGNTFPVYLGPLDSVDIKYVFIRKGLSS